MPETAPPTPPTTPPTTPPSPPPVIPPRRPPTKPSTRPRIETCLKLAADATRPIRQIAQNLIVSQVAVVQNGQEVADIGDRQALKERRRRDADAIAAAT
uniref:Transcriptional regulator n=1 Tax=Panagrellus redivivus TaxID=6233 RepID=A0A7E4V599_PANRE